MAIRTIVESLTLTRPIGPQTEAQARAEQMVLAAISASCERIAALSNPLDRAVFSRDCPPGRSQHH